MSKIDLSHRIASKEDKPAIIKLMQESIEENMKDFLSSGKDTSFKWIIVT